MSREGMVQAWRYSNCPTCGQYGSMIIVWFTDEDRLAVRCDECGLSYFEPEDADSFDNGFEGRDLSFAYPSFETIHTAGWSKYCTERMPDREQPER